MSAPLFLLEEGALAAVEAGDSVALGGPEGHHAVTVSRMRPGQPILLADGSGALAACRVADVGKGVLSATIDSITVEPVPRPRFTLIQALAKGDRDLLAAEVGTELGVDEVVPWEADRSIVRWRGERAEKAQRKWRNTLVAATKQARRSRVPVLGAVADRSAVVDRIAAADLAFVLHESARTPLSTVLPEELPTHGEILLIVGPEGGISVEELSEFVEAGARAVLLGSTVLRTSTAGSAAIAVLSSLGRWRG
ncbi:MAG: 16S rRNA (uracil(1498)-N(3))-methyltransferase [Ornithinimicrobium sp.]